MNRFKFCTFIALITILSFTSIGCRKRTKQLTDIPGGSGRIPIQNGIPNRQLPPSDPFLGEGEIGATDLPGPEGIAGMTPDAETLRPYTVYFDFDRSSVRADQQANIDAVAQVLQQNPGAKLQVEGHCDERGTEEYNRALGERRALSVREALMARGISPDRILTVSYGEDRPAVPGHDESAYSLNRRAEFILYTR